MADPAESDKPDSGSDDSGSNSDNGDENNDDNDNSLTTASLVAIIAGSVAIGIVLILGLLYRYRRRRRNRAGFGTWPNGPRKGPSSDDREKGMEALMGIDSPRDDAGSAPKSKSSWGPGPFSARVVETITSTLGRGRRIDPYAVLADEGQAIPTQGVAIGRRSSDKEGKRVVGPRPAPGPRSLPAQLRISTSRGSNRSSRNSVHSSRLDMLHDEDSRRFPPIEEEDWRRSTDDEDSPWSSARSILEGMKHDPFDDAEDVSPVAPVIRGGPVPTPDASRLNLDHFDGPAYNSRRSTLGSMYSDLLSAPPGYSDSSFTPSSRSGRTGASVTDTEEATVEQARIISPQRSQPTLISPVRSVDAFPTPAPGLNVMSNVAPTPRVERRESLFKRVTRDGLGSLLYRSGSTNAALRFLDIRDPTPPPALQPLSPQIQTSESGSSSQDRSGPRFPPTAFKLNDMTPSHSKGPSLSSLQSARSMRDMVIVQRDGTDESETRAESGEIGTTSDFGSEASSLRTNVDSVSTAGPSSKSEEGKEKEVAPPVSKAEAKRLEVPCSASSTTDFGLPPPTLRHVDQPEHIITRSPSPAVSTSSTSHSISEPPQGSPVPNPLLSHRRPVKEVVQSINKRGGGIPSKWQSASSSPSLSPLASAPASPSPSASPRRGLNRVREDSAESGTSSAASGRKRPTTMYEAVKREKLMVTNPDKKQRTSSG